MPSSLLGTLLRKAYAVGLLHIMTWAMSLFLNGFIAGIMCFFKVKTGGKLLVNSYLENSMGCLKLSYYEQEEALEANPKSFLRVVGKNDEAPKNRLSSSTYGFNGMEKDDEVKGSGNSLDFGARMYDSRVGRWLSIDPLAGKYPDVNPYCFVLNNPIYLVDPDGKEVHIHITTQKVGTVQIRLIGSENVAQAPKTVAVSIYKMTVTDDVSGTTSIYYVTRDAPVISGKNSNGTFEVVNTTFEPASGAEDLAGISSEYPAGTGMTAITLATKKVDPNTKKWVRELDAEPNKYAVSHGDRNVEDVSKGNAIHVGGEYTAADGSQRVTGSFGCFTLCGKDEGNSGNLAFKKDIANRAATNRAAGKGGSINVQLDKRADKDVILKADVNKSGKVTKVKETQ